MRTKDQAIVYVGPDGLLKFVYADELASLLHLGQASIDRASHVEPTKLGWEADLAPVGGPTLGPFSLRGEALEAEVNWLDRHLATSSTE